MNKRGVERVELVLECERRPAQSPDSMAFWKSAQRRGATLAVTEMQPVPPIALKPKAISSLPESWTKSAPQSAALRGDPGEIAGARP